MKEDEGVKPRRSIGGDSRKSLKKVKSEQIIEEEPKPNSICIEVYGYENIVPVYAVTEVVTIFELNGEILGETPKVQVANNALVPINYKLLLPCDLTSSDDVAKFISHPITVKVMEMQKDVDMSKVQLFIDTKSVTQATRIKAKSSGTTASGSINRRSLSKQDKQSLLEKKKKSKEKTPKVEKQTKLSDSTIEESKLKKAKNYFDTKPEPNEVRPVGPQILGIALLDLLPLFMGKSQFDEALFLRPVKQILDEKAVANLDLPKMQVSVSLDGPSIDDKRTNIFNVSIESIYNLPNIMTENYRYQASVVVPLKSQKPETISFDFGAYATETDFIKYKQWPRAKDDQEPMESTYRIDNEMEGVINKFKIDLNSSITPDKARIEYNTINRLFLDTDSKDRLFRYLLDRRRISVEIYVTPKTMEPTASIVSDASTKKKTAKKEKGTGKGSSSTMKSKTTNELDEIDYLHLMAIVDVGQLLHPGVQTCRVACPLNTYQQLELDRATGMKESVYKQKSQTMPQDTRESTRGDKKKDKKDKKKDSKPSKSSKSSESSKKLNKKGKGKKEATDSIDQHDLAQLLPPPAPPDPEPSKRVFNEKGEPTFILLEIGFIKPLRPQRTLEDLSKKLNTILQKPPKLSKNIHSTTVAESIYDETIRSLARDMDVQYKQYKVEKKDCKCEHSLDFLEYLQQSGMYQTYLTSIMRALAALIPEKYQFDKEHQRKSTVEFQIYIRELYTEMVQQMNKVVNEMTVFHIDKKPHKHMVKNEQLLLFAKEATELDEYELAERYYLERICCNEDNADFWFDYAVFQNEIKNVDGTVECLKEVLRLDSMHRHGLLMFGLVLLQKGKMAEAETCLLAMSLMHPRWTEGWGALFTYYAEARNVEGMEVAMQMAQKYSSDTTSPNYFQDTDDLSWSTQFCDENVYLKTASLLVKMRIHKNYGVAGLIGHCFLKMDNHPDALVFYEMVLAMFNRPDDVHLIYLFGAISHDVTGNTQAARKLALLACQYSPTVQSWMHAGSYYFKQNDLLSAEECLTQANLYDNRLPEPWAYLALINAHLGKEHETELCLTQAKKFDTKNSPIIANVEKMLNTMKSRQ